EWLTENPLSVPTEREIATFNKGEPVYRVLFRKVGTGD
ncbi:tRNA (guanosine(46)-N7)-methyltransferase TrmB, partial [Aerosakkonemataceae cyanobacterium BLCC-F154]